MRPDDTPLEANLGFICKLKTDIPFLGRAALEEQQRNVCEEKNLFVVWLGRNAHAADVVV